MTTLDALFDALDCTPDDWVARAALADCFEEAGLDTTAACLRWTLAHRLRPSHRLSDGAMWFDGGQPYLIHTDADAYLPAALFSRLREGQPYWMHARLYSRPRDAEEDLFAAFAEAVCDGWLPESS